MRLNYKMLGRIVYKNLTLILIKYRFGPSHIATKLIGMDELIVVPYERLGSAYLPSLTNYAITYAYFT